MSSEWYRAGVECRQPFQIGKSRLQLRACVGNRCNDFLLRVDHESNPLDVGKNPGLFEQRLPRTMESEDREPLSSQPGVNPVVRLIARRTGTEIDVDGSVGVRFSVPPVRVNPNSG